MDRDTLVDRTADLEELNGSAVDGRAWKAFKTRHGTMLNGALAAILSHGSKEDRAMILSDLRHVHHVIYVADRIRKAAIEARKDIPKDLRAIAELLLQQAGKKDFRSTTQAQYTTSARVNWHMLLKRAGVRTSSSSGLPQQLQEVAGRPFGDDEVPSLVARKIRKPLAALITLIDEAVITYPSSEAELYPLRTALDDCVAKLPSGRLAASEESPTR